MKLALRILLVVGVSWMTLSDVYANSCCPNFSTQQKAFLQTMLKAEAQGLKAGMMNAFSVPQVRWFNVSTQEVCFGAKGNIFGTFNIKDEGFISAIKLVHSSGLVTCDKSTLAKTPDEFNSKWGCSPNHPTFGKNSLNTLITTKKNKIVFPHSDYVDHEPSSYWYTMGHFDSDSDVLVFQRFQDPLYVSKGQELRLWYGEDLGDFSEGDNGGQTCAHVLAYYL